MTKQAFLDELKVSLAGLPESDIDERLAFYGEMIDDKTEDGISESEAVGEIGPIEDILSQLASDIPLKTLVKEKIKPKRKLGALEITLIVLGFPAWFPLLVSAAAVVLSLYMSVWTVILSLWAVCLSLVIGFIGCMAAAVVCAVKGQFILAAVFLSASFVIAGITIFMLFGCKVISKGIIVGTKKAIIKLKSSLIRKGRSK